MNNFFSKVPCFSLCLGQVLPRRVTRTGSPNVLILGLLAAWPQGFSLGQTQDGTANPSEVTIIDKSWTNEGQEIPPNSSQVAVIDESLTNAPPDTSEKDGLNGKLPYLPPPDTTPPASPSADADATADLPPTVGKAIMYYTEGKPDQALATINAVLTIKPKNVDAYILRGAIFSQKEDWDKAEKDFQTALQMDPKNDGVRFDLADLKFKQKQFDAARVALVPLQDNKDFEVSDLIKYKIYLCDLLGGHDDVASKELEVFNQAGSNASYYFGNAAWNLVHKKPEEARGWLVSASHIYPDRKQAIYTSILNDMGYLPLPPPPDAK